MGKDETPILPQAAALLVISYLVYRYFWTSAPSSTNPTAAPTRAAARRFDPRRLQQQVEAVHGMFPQISQAAIEAELIRNGGNIEVATERILSTGFLPEPPQPAPRAAAPAAAPAMRAAPTGSRPRPAASAQVGPQYTDLITRYNLQDRLAEQMAAEKGGAKATGKGKAPASKQDRHLAHKAKRDDMILQARRQVEKLIEKEDAKA